jgi:hypothetical protein
VNRRKSLVGRLQKRLQIPFWTFITAKELWDGPLGEDGWLRVSSTILETLGQVEIPEMLSARVGTWAAVGVYLMHEHRPTTGHPAEAKWYEDAARAVAHLLVDADEDLVADFSAPFTNANGYPVDPDAVLQVVGVVVQGHPLCVRIR